MTRWTWRYEAEDGATVAGPPEYAASTQTFDNQSDAESWLGETWPELYGAGVHQVTLLNDGAVIYGPMGLGPV